MRSKLARACVGAAALVTFVLASQLVAKSSSKDWPQFRGVNRDGVSLETGLASSWPESGPNEIWRVPLGNGYSGISVVGDRIYTMFAAGEGDDAKEYAAAFEVKTGKEVWRTPMGPKYVNTFGDGPRSTPTVDGSTVYVLDSNGNLASLATKDGSEQWKLSLTETFGSRVPTFGFSTSVLIDGDRLIVEGGGKDGKSYAALNKKTGETIWTFGSGPDDPSYNSPIKVKMNGKSCYVYIVGDKMECVGEDGKEHWSFPWQFPGETHGMPIFVAPNKIFAAGAEGVGGKLVEVKGDTPEEVWATRFMRNHFSSSVVHDGYVYGFDNATLRSISLKDGETAWAKRGFGKGSLIVADGHLVVLSDAGRLLLVEATHEGYNEKGSVQALEGRCWTSPTIANGRLYLRNHDEMVSYDVTK